MIEADLDLVVLSAVRGGMNRLMAIEAHLGVRDMSVRKSLQRLRKSGKIANGNGRGWHIPSKPKPSR